MPIAANANFPNQNMPNELFRDLLIVNRHTFDEAVASVRSQANRDIDRA